MTRLLRAESAERAQCSRWCQAAPVWPSEDSGPELTLSWAFHSDTESKEHLKACVHVTVRASCPLRSWKQVLDLGREMNPIVFYMFVESLWVLQEVPSVVP